MEHFILADKYTIEDRKNLLKLAQDAIFYGLKHQQVMPIKLEDYAAHLQEIRAVFVTLEINKNLRGCIGSLEAHRPLVEDIAYNAYAAAFSDPRFSPLNEAEFPQLKIHISILNQAEPMQFTSEQDLIRQLRPGVDGLILTDNGFRGTFLPSVWESLPKSEDFLAHLKLKAGLPQNYWSDTIKIERYTVESIP